MSNVMTLANSFPIQKYKYNVQDYLIISYLVTMYSIELDLAICKTLMRKRNG